MWRNCDVHGFRPILVGISDIELAVMDVCVSQSLCELESNTASTYLIDSVAFALLARKLSANAACVPENTITTHLPFGFWSTAFVYSSGVNRSELRTQTCKYSHAPKYRYYIILK